MAVKNVSVLNSTPGAAANIAELKPLKNARINAIIPPATGISPRNASVTFNIAFITPLAPLRPILVKVSMALSIILSMVGFTVSTIWRLNMANSSAKSFKAFCASGSRVK